jgi:hypothetical protein
MEVLLYMKHERIVQKRTIRVAVCDSTVGRRLDHIRILMWIQPYVSISQYQHLMGYAVAQLVEALWSVIPIKRGFTATKRVNMCFGFSPLVTVHNSSSSQLKQVLPLLQIRISIERLALLPCSRKILGSDPENVYTDLYLSWLSSVPPGKCRSIMSVQATVASELCPVHYLLVA